jgi:hypothetical protein
VQGRYIGPETRALLAAILSIFFLPFFGVNGPQRIMTQNRTRRRAASSEAFALYVIVAGCGRAPKIFPKRAHLRVCSHLARIM